MMVRLFRYTSLSRVILVLASLGGCSRCGPQNEPVISAKPPALEHLKPPGTVLGYGGADKLESLIESTATFAGAIHPMGAAISGVLPRAIEQWAGLESLEGVDLDAPLRFVYLDPNTYYGERSRMLLLTLRSDEKHFAATLPSERKMKDRGNAYSYRGADGQERFVNLVGRMAVISYAPALARTLRPFLTALARATVRGGLEFIVSVENIKKTHTKQIDKYLSQLSSWRSQHSKNGGKLSDTPWQRSLIDGTERAAFVLNTDAKHFALEMIVKAHEKSDLEQVFRAMRPVGGRSAGAGSRVLPNGISSAIGLFPEQSPFLAATYLDMELFRPLAKKAFRELSTWAITLANQAGDYKKNGPGWRQRAEKLQGKVLRLLDFWDGNAVMAVHRPEHSGQEKSGVPWTSTSIYKMSKPSEVRVVFDEVKRLLQEGATADKDLDYQIDTTPVYVFSQDGVFPARSAETHYAVIENIGLVGAIGPAARPAIARLVQRRPEDPISKHATLNKRLAALDKGTFGWAYLSASDLVRLVRATKTKATERSNDASQSSSGMIVSAAADEGRLAFSFRLPVEEARSLSQAIGYVAGPLSHLKNFSAPTSRGPDPGNP